MRKILLSTVLLSTLLLSDQSVEEKRQQIADTKAKIEALQASLKEMEASLPEQIQKAQTIQAEASRIKTHAELGYVNSKGNSDTQTLTIDAKVKKDWDMHALSLAVDVEYASDNGADTKNKRFAELEYNYKLNKKLYLQYILGYKYDAFSGYDYNIYTGPGLKYLAIDEKEQELTFESNILYATDKKENKSAYNYASFRAKGFYSLQVLENLKFEETLTYRTDVSKVDNYYIFSKTALISKLTDIFSASLSYKVDYVNQAGADKEHTDRTLSANLIADF